MKINLQLIEMIAAELEPYREDAATFWDTLDGETDVLDALDVALSAKLHDDAMVDAIKAAEADLRARRSRVEMRAEATRRVLGQMLAAAGAKSVERPRGTVSIRPGSVSVNITDADAIPSQLCTVKTVTSPDKKAIKAQIDAGETVPGAEIVRGADIVSVRVK